jgi:type IV fimbrial biogenesis protein FimT
MIKHDKTSRSRLTGFTLLELMVTLALAAILATLAVPYLGEFIVRNKLPSINQEFNGSVLRARNEAVSKNTCVTMCYSDTTDSVAPVCRAGGQEWHTGWIVFLNPDCDSAQPKPLQSDRLTYAAEDLILIQRPSDNAYTLMSDKVGWLMFNPRGSSGLSSATRFTLNYLPSPPLTLKYSTDVCLDSLGRTRNIPPSASTCASF